MNEHKSEARRRRNPVREECERRGWHYDPVLIAFVAFALIVAFARLALAQPAGGPVASSPAVDPGMTLLGFPLGAVIQIGVPAALAIYMVVKAIPNLQAGFSASLAEERASCAAREDKIRAENAAREIAMRESYTRAIEADKADIRRLQELLLDRDRGERRSGGGGVPG